MAPARAPAVVAVLCAVQIISAFDCDGSAQPILVQSLSHDCPAEHELLPLDGMRECAERVCDLINPWSVARGADPNWVIFGRGSWCMLEPQNATDLTNLVCIPTGTYTFTITETITATNATDAPDAGGSHELSAGSAFLVIFAVAVTAYCAGGILLNLLVFNVRGLRVIPHWDFWRGLPALMRDGLRCLVGKPPVHAYGQIPV